MQYRFRKPKPVPLLATLVTVALMFALCGWQLYRLQWKLALIASIEQAQSQAPTELLSYAPDALAAHEWYNVVAKGKLLNDKEMYATPRYLDDQMGFAVLTPLEMDTPTGARYVIINRGWVAQDKKDPHVRASGNPQIPVRVEGVIRKTLPQGMFRPDNNLAKNLWFWYDIPAMAQFTHLPLYPVMIDATRVTLADGSAITGGPTPFPMEVSIRNDHLGYAITWFLIGLSALAMFVLSHMERKTT